MSRSTVHMIAIAATAAAIAIASFLLGYRTARNEEIKRAQSSGEYAALAEQAARDARLAAAIQVVDRQAREEADRAAEEAIRAAEAVEHGASE